MKTINEIKNVTWYNCYRPARETIRECEVDISNLQYAVHTHLTRVIEQEITSFIHAVKTK